MADDIRTRLSEALDENQREIDGREGARVIPLKFRGEWRAVDRPLAEALVERDRQLLADHEPHTIAIFTGMDSMNEHWVEVDKCSCSPLGLPQYTPWPCREVDRVAAFWLGTQEADR